MKRKLSILFFLVLLSVLCCTTLADNGKLGMVTVADYICLEGTTTQYKIHRYYDRSDEFYDYIYPGTTLYIESSETLSALSVDLVPAQRQTYTGNSNGLTFVFYYIMDEETYEQVKYDDENKYMGFISSPGSGGIDSSVEYGYQLLVSDEKGQALRDYTMSITYTDYDGTISTVQKATDEKGKAGFWEDSVLGLSSVYGYLPTANSTSEEDKYGNPCGVITNTYWTGDASPLIIKDTNGKQIASIQPKTMDSYLAPCKPKFVSIDNSFFAITADASYSVTISSPNPNDEGAWYVPLLTVKIQKKKDINNYAAAVINKSYEYTGKAITPSVKIEGLTLGTDYEIVSYKNNTNIGTASVTVKGIGACSGTRTLNFEIYVNKKYTFSSGNLKYKVTTTRYETNNHVQVTGGVNKNLTKVSIPATVTLGGVKFKVTSINKNAFKGYAKLQTATIGKNVTSIGASAFYNCKKLSSVTISTGLKGINAQAFMNCKNLKKLTIKSTVLTIVGKNALKSIHKNCVIKVPKKKLAAYKKLLSGKGQAKTVKITK